MPLVKLDEIKEFRKGRYLSKLLHDSQSARVALFCLEPGQEVSPHTSSSEVIFQVVEGKGKVVIGAEEPEVEPGIVAICPPGLPHGLKAETRFVVVAVIAPRP